MIGGIPHCNVQQVVGTAFKMIGVVASYDMVYNFCWCQKISKLYAILPCC